jgi:MHS family proline/betaine transporter-like MFS transporter
MAPPHLTQHQQLGLLFAIFAAGHVLWLAGCFVWPWLSARVGRCTVLAWTVGLSAFPTALLGCMPTYAEVRSHTRQLLEACI